MQHYVTKSVSEFLSVMCSLLYNFRKKVIYLEEIWRRAVSMMVIELILSDSEGRLLI